VSAPWCGRGDDQTGSLGDDVEGPDFGLAGAGVVGAMDVPEPLVDEDLPCGVGLLGTVVALDEREVPRLDDHRDGPGVGVPVRAFARLEQDLLDGGVRRPGRDFALFGLVRGFGFNRGRLLESIGRTSYREAVTAISERDAVALLEIVHEGASDVGRESFPSSVLWALSRLIPSDACVGYQEADVAGGFRVVDLIEVVGEPLSPAAEAAYDTLGRQNPMHCQLHAHESRVLRLSDLLTRRQRRTLEWNAIVWQPHGIDDALRLWLPAEQGRSRSIYLERSGRNYTDRELTLLSLLRPHLVRMQRSADFRRRFDGDNGLTSREAEVLGWIARGKTNREIASRLFVSPHTVRKHIENIFEKLGVRTRTAAARHAGGTP